MNESNPRSAYSATYIARRDFMKNPAAAEAWPAVRRVTTGFDDKIQDSSEKRPNPTSFSISPTTLAGIMFPHTSWAQCISRQIQTPPHGRS